VARALAADPPVMLMDEPFGAVDPIVRSRLQDEFLRLQAELRKTIVFVTHDIDEAIKMGDRVAILNVGGVLEQYDTPAEILRDPADEFVQGFLGSDRGIKRLSLITIRDVGLVRGPVVGPGDPPEAARRAMEEYSLDWFAVVEGDRFLGWASGSDLRDGAPAGDLSLRPILAAVDLGDSLRDALDVVITSHSRVALVFDGDRYAGMLTTEEIGREIVQ
jgi:osmoprotectant transport system ATP-binding protein